MVNNIPNIILEEAKQLPDDLLKEVLDFVLFLKTKNKTSTQDELSSLQQNELSHLFQPRSYHFRHLLSLQLLKYLHHRQEYLYCLHAPAFQYQGIF